MTENDKQFDEKIAAFEREREPAFLKEALEMIQAQAQRQAGSDSSGRTQMFIRWLRFLAVLDHAIDPLWRAEDQPVTGLVPPPVKGMIYPSGVDPAAIPDPGVRAEYESTLKASKDHAENYLIQEQLRRIDGCAMDEIEKTLGAWSPLRPADCQELAALATASATTSMAESSINAERLARLQAILSSLSSERNLKRRLDL